MIRLGNMTLAMSALMVTAASAQGLDPELTMRPMPNAAVDVPAALADLLELPESAAEQARLSSAAGLETANQNRLRAAENREAALARAAERRAAGLETAADARERGPAFGADMAEAAMGVRENLVRGGGQINLPIPADFPQLPAHVPGRPELSVPPVDLPIDRPDRPALPDQAGGSS